MSDKDTKEKVIVEEPIIVEDYSDDPTAEKDAGTYDGGILWVIWAIIAVLILWGVFAFGGQWWVI